MDFVNPENLGCGIVPAIVCVEDERFCYYLYVPKKLKKNMNVYVVVHGSERGAETLRNAFIEFAEKLEVIILAPLFPMGVGDPNDKDNYKHLISNGVRYDLILLYMLENINKRYGANINRFVLFGFSGGAQFCHRFFYLYPEKIAALSVCAPGSVTLPDVNKPWWVGVSNIREIFNCEFNEDAMRKALLHLAVGENDIHTGLITHVPGSKHWQIGANDAGITRVDRLMVLNEKLVSIGLRTVVEILPGIGHERGPLVDAAKTFFLNVHKSLFCI